MHVQTFVLSFAIAASGLVPLACLAQQPPGAATLETSVSGDDSKAKTAGTVRPAGTLVRPQDGVQHPDLDKAWTEYDAAVAKVTESIKAIIAKQFDAATEKGDLDAAEKWQVIGENFAESGKLPTATETKATVSAAVAEYKKAREELTNAYEAVVKVVTTEKKIKDARAVKNELAELLSGTQAQAALEAVFLSDLQERDVFVGHGAFGKNEDLGYQGFAIQVAQRRIKKGLSMHPPTNSSSSVTYDVPDGFTHFAASAAINDSALAQRTPLVFRVMDGERVLWQSQPIRGAGSSEECAVALKGAKTVTLTVFCPGTGEYAQAVWCDPRFLKK
jgi:hypothetical protein